MESIKMKMKKLNAEWHRKNRMPERATLDQRVRWHLKHQRNCGCREMPESVKKEIRKRAGGR
jgi:hypothetical protein